MTDAEQDIFNRLCRANAADAEILDDDHPGLRVGKIMASVLAVRTRRARNEGSDGKLLDDDSSTV